MARSVVRIHDQEKLVSVDDVFKVPQVPTREQIAKRLDILPGSPVPRAEVLVVRIETFIREILNG